MPDDEVAAGGVRERPLGEKLPDGFKVKTPEGDTWNITGGVELHRLALEEFDQLERRAGEINEENINLTCSVNGGTYKEVRQAPSQTPPQVTPLFLACGFQAWNAALLLLSRGADPNKAGRYSNGNVETPLYWAACSNSTAVCRSLLANGARLDKGGNTCFFICHRHHQMRWLCFSLLIIIICHHHHHH